MSRLDSHLPLKALDHPATLACARQTLEIEAQAILALKARLGVEFVQAVELMLACQGA